jgi:tetratricopeptide (TPR) repeat protein
MVVKFLAIALFVFGVSIKSAWAGGARIDKIELLGLLRQGNFAELENRLNRLQADSESRDGEDEAVAIAFSAFANPKPDVLKRLNEWVQAKPDSYAARLARGYHYRELGWQSRGYALAEKTSEEQFRGIHENFAAARRDLYAAIEINNKLSVATALLLGMAGTESLFEDMVQLLQVGLTQAPKSYHVRWMFLHNLQPRWGGSHDQITKFIEVLVEPYADDPAIRSLLGYGDYARARDLYSDKEFEEALALFDRATGKGRHWIYFYWHGKTLKRLGRMEEALASYDQALSLRPYEPDVRASRAWILYKAGRLEEALADYTKSLLFDPWSASTLTSRAVTYRNLERYDLALEDLNRALALKEDSARARNIRGRILLYNYRNAEKALPDLERALELAPDNIFNWYNHSVALKQLRDCRVMTSLKRFQELCRSNERSCPANEKGWVDQQYQLLVNGGYCPG